MIDIKQWKEEMYPVVGAIQTVHQELGPGLNEICYQEALELELAARNIDAKHEQSFHPHYHGVELSCLFRIDFMCNDNIIVECKSVEALTAIHRAQLFNYMRLLGKPCGILVNFAPSYATIERYFFDSNTKTILTVDGRPFAKTK